MLSCLLNGKRINCFDNSYSREQLKKWASKKILLCPACGKPYEYCHGRIKSPYFRHMDKTQCEDHYSESETEEHINGKRDLYEWIKKQSNVTDVILEGWIFETKQKPDIMFKYKGKQYVIEYQCSPIASEYLERHELYKAADIIDIWICGTEKYFNGGRHKFIETFCSGHYDPKNKIFYLNTDSLQYNTITFFTKLNRQYEHQFHLKDFIFYNGEILFYCLKNQDYHKALEKSKERKILKKQLKSIENKKFEDKIEFIKDHINSCKITIHYPNYWNHEATYIRFCRNSNNTIKFKDSEHIYLKINNFFRIEKINKILRQYNKKYKTWNFWLESLLISSEPSCLYVCINDDKGISLYTAKKYLSQNELIQIKKEEKELKNILLENMIKCKEHVIASKNNNWKVINW